MDERVETWLTHIIMAIDEIDGFFKPGGRKFETFCSTPVLRRAVERNIMIIGEAMSRILKRHPDISIAHTRQIIATRNHVVHGYDMLEDEALWNIVINHLQPLKKEVETLLNENNETL